MTEAGMIDQGFQAIGINNDLLTDISFSVQPGQCLAVHGASGAGKSVLLRALADLVEFSGTIALHGKISHHFSAPAWRKKVTLLPPESSWWFDTVNKHLPEVDSELLHSLGFEDDVLQWEINRLSSGEKQRLALVRALCHHPEVLLLDEPTSNLDPDNGLRVEELLSQQRSSNGLMLIWVSHDEAQRQRIATSRLHITNGRGICS